MNKIQIIARLCGGYVRLGGWPLSLREYEKLHGHRVDGLGSPSLGLQTF